MNGEDDVHLELRGDFVEYEAHPREITIRIPIHIWEHVRHYGGFSPRYHLMDDTALLEHVTQKVDDRIKAWEESNRSGLMAFAGSLVYGSTDEPREDQIKHGFENLSIRRAEERAIVERIRTLNEEHAKTYDGSGIFVFKVSPNADLESQD
jgi:hypothetical protein